jgi:outer membrane protein TolC
LCALLLLASCVPFSIGIKGDGILSPEAISPNAQSPGSEKFSLPEEGPIELTIIEAIVAALGNNKSLRIEKLSPALRRESVKQAKAAFDPSLSAGASYSRSRTKDDDSDSRSYSSGADVGISKHMPSGTDINAGLATSRSWGELYSDSHATGLDITITQALLQGRDPRANLASLHQAKLDVEVSLYELRGFTESLVAQVETTYWDYALAKRQIEIYTGSLKLAEQQLSETRERVKVGKLAETELAAAQAQVALRKEDLINARSNLEKTRLKLLRLLNPPGDNLWDREIVLKNEPAVPDVTLDKVEAHVAVAMMMRPDLNQATLSLKRGELEVVQTKNGLLPRLDLFVTLGKTGYAESFHGSVDGFNRGSYNWSASLSLEYPLGNRAAKARQRQAVLNLEQARESIENLRQLVQVDVRSAYIEVNRAKEQVSATAATRKLQEETLRTETEKFRVGKSTTFLVAQAQRDLVASQVSEIQAIVMYLKALVELFRLEGSLLERRGIAAPKSDPTGLLTGPGAVPISPERRQRKPDQRAR